LEDLELLLEVRLTIIILLVVLFLGSLVVNSVVSLALHLPLFFFSYGFRKSLVANPDLTSRSLDSLLRIILKKLVLGPLIILYSTIALD
jgi:hypothetical protein